MNVDHIVILFLQIANVALSELLSFIYVISQNKTTGKELQVSSNYYFYATFARLLYFVLL